LTKAPPSTVGSESAMDSVAGSREKVQRAYKHLEDFESGFSEFLRENPQRIWHDPSEPGVQKSLFIRQADVPATLICIVGDAIHNLRSALDHLAFAVAVRNGVAEKSLRETDFTIRKTAKAFREAITEQKVTRIGIAWIRFLKRIEPYHGGQGSDLYVVSALDNLDKHRSLIVVEALADTFIRNEKTQAFEPVERGLSFKQGIEIALDPGDPKYHTHTQTRVIIREAISGLDPDAWANAVLKALAGRVSAAIDDAESDKSLWP
jgi:hypothetical protein